jgi:glycosyltransferase involved in cell wall biosynthesis
MLTSPHRRCGIRDITDRLLEGGLQDRFTVRSGLHVFQGEAGASELIHLQYHPTYVEVAAFRQHCPLGKRVATLHDARRFEQISDLFDAIVVHNERDAALVRAMPLQAGAEVVVIPLGAPPPLATAFEPSLRRDPVIAFHGFLGPHKGLRYLIEALPEIRRFYPKARLLIVSTQNAFNEAEGQLCLEEGAQGLAELGLTSAARFETEFLPQEEILSLLHREADLVVLPYASTGKSGSSGAVRVAMAAAKPCLVSDIPLFGDLTQEVVKFPLSQLATLSQLICHVWRQPQLQRWLVNRALARVTAESWPAAAQQHQQLYARVMAKARSSSK